jgi:hypothetical protein
MPLKIFTDKIFSQKNHVETRLNEFMDETKIGHELMFEFWGWEHGDSLYSSLHFVHF